MANRIVDAEPRRRAVIIATVRTARSLSWHQSPAYVCEIGDPSGTLTVVFTGRQKVPGLVRGSCCRFEGTVQRTDDGLLIWNPLYCFAPAYVNRRYPA
ncbi:MAG: single stranded DNA-binding domain-containing protein [Acidimicrobiales bacterium]